MGIGIHSVEIQQRLGWISVMLLLRFTPPLPLDLGLLFPSSRVPYVIPVVVEHTSHPSQVRKILAPKFRLGPLLSTDEAPGTRTEQALRWRRFQSWSVYLVNT